MSNITNNPFALIKLSKTTTVCFEKSALCDGELVIKELVVLDAKNTESQVSQIISNVVNAVNEQNPLTKALKKQYDFEQSSIVKAVLPYDQEKQLMGATFTGGKTFIIGLLENMLLKNKPAIAKKCEEFIGQDVYVLGLGNEEVVDGSYNNEMDAVALIVVKENIRESIPSSIKWLNENNINVKITSNEDAQKASSIAYEVGTKDVKSVSLKEMSDEQVKSSAKQFAIFGDASKEQQEMIIKSLKEDGEKVLVINHAFENIVGTLKKSKTFAINLQRAGLLFIAKAIFAVLLTLVFVFALASKAFDFPVGLYRFLVFSVVIDIAASVLLMLDKKQNKSKDKFLIRVLKVSLPGALLMFISAVVIFALLVSQQNKTISLGIYDNQVASAMCAIAFATLGIVTLFNVCEPLTKYRRLVLSSISLLTILLLLLAAVISYTTHRVDVLFGIPFMEMNGPAYLVTGMIIVLLTGLYLAFYKVFRKDVHNEN